MMPVTSQNEGVQEADGATKGTYLSVVSSNLLAPLYVRPYDKRTGGIQPFAAFEWISKEDTSDILDMDGGRGKRLLNNLRSCKADVICLQELQLERSSPMSPKTPSSEDGEQGETTEDTPRCDSSRSDFVLPKWMQPLIEEDGYDVHLPPQTELDTIAERNVRVLGADTAVTCAILYRIDRLMKLNANDGGEQQSDNIGDGCDADADTNTCVSICLQGRIAETNSSPSLGPCVISSVHLDATDERKRVGQMTRCIRRARKLISAAGGHTLSVGEQKAPLTPISAIIAGDFNQELFSGGCISAFLRRHKATSQEMKQVCAEALRLNDGSMPTDQQMEQWMGLHSEVKKVIYDHCLELDRINTGCTRSAYDHSNTDADEMLRSEPQMAQWRLDHMLYTPVSLRPCAIWSTLEDDPEACGSGLPNRRHGSDHISIAALFECQNIPNLSNEEKQMLFEKIRCMDEEQKRHLQSTRANLDIELVHIKGKIKPDMNEIDGCGSTAEGSKKVKKKKKKKTGPPPKEIIDHIRKTRSIIKNLKLSQMEQRRALISDLKDLHRLAIEEEFGHNAAAWIEK